MIFSSNSFSVPFLFLIWSRIKFLKCPTFLCSKGTENEIRRFWGISKNYENAITWQNPPSRAFWGISWYLVYFVNTINSPGTYNLVLLIKECIHFDFKSSEGAIMIFFKLKRWPYWYQKRDQIVNGWILEAFWGKSKVEK